MADITMCLQENCDKTEMCYRKTAKMGMYQSFSNHENCCAPNYEMFYEDDRKIIITENKK